MMYHMHMASPTHPPAACCAQDELGSPALAFVRLLVHLLSLDGALEDQVRLLRRSLLRLVGVDEFSPAANWADPCISFRLPDVICRSGGAQGLRVGLTIGSLAGASTCSAAHQPP
jgi:hypothetical protein